MSFLGSLGLSAGDSLFSGASDALFGGIKAKRNWKYKKKEMELQQQYNVENMERQYGYQVDMLNRQNQWNAPTNQVSMWRQAGISPTAVFGSGNGGVGLSGTPSGPSSSNPSASGNVDNSQATKSAIFSEAKRLQNETKVAASVVDKNEADAAAARAAAARDQADADTKNLFRDDLLEGVRLGNLGKGFENRIAEQNAKLKEATTPIEIERATASLRNIVEDTNLKREQVNEILSRIRLNEEYVKTEGSRRANLDARTETENKLRESRKNQLNAAVRELGSAADLKDEQKDVVLYDLLERLTNSTRPKSWAEFIGIAFTELRRLGADLTDWRKDKVSKILEKIWSNSGN